jgi:signal transduction histidine kinase
MAAPAESKSSVRLAWLLIGSFALTIASFVTVTVVSEYRARGIEDAAESITTNALPSIECLSNARTELRQIALLLERLSDGGSGDAGVALDTARLQRSRDALAHDWNTCLVVPNYPGEFEMEESNTARLGEMNASIENVLRSLKARDFQATQRELFSTTQPIIDQVDAQMVDEIALNARQSTALGARIASLRTSAQHTRTFFDILSAILAATAALVMVRILRRFVSLMETRVSDLELFASRVAHDIRSPLASVGLALELTKRDPDLGLRKGLIDRAAKTLQRVGQLVDGLLILARAGKTPDEGAQADVGEVLSGVVDEMRPSAEQNGITLELEPPEPATAISCSAGVLISLLSNLLGNAIKYMGTSPVRRVTVRTRDLGRALLFEVSDTGPGVQPSLRERIFDPYVRAAESTIPGIGLGLATVRRLAEAHGGSVGVRSNPDGGSIFWFQLPKREQPSRVDVARKWVPKPS